MNKILNIDAVSNYKIILALVLILAAILRFYHIDFQSPWLDEIHTLNEANPNYSLKEVYNHVTRAEQLPPLYFYLMHFIFKIFGYSVVVARGFSAILGVFSVYAFFLLAKELINKKTALISALLLAVNYYMIFYAQEARPYTLFVLFTILSYYRMILFLKNNSIKNTIWFGVAACFMLHSHVVGFFTLFSQFITLLLYFILQKNLDRTLFFKRGMLAALVLVILYLPALDALLNLFDIKSFWIKQPTQNALSSVYKGFFADSEIVLFLNLIFLTLFVFWMSKIKDKTRVNKISQQWIAVIIILWISLTILVPLIRTYVSVPMIIGRYFVALVPAVLLIFAIGLSTLKNRVLRNTLLTIYVIYTLLHLTVINDYYTKVNKAQFREVTSFIVDNNINNDAVVSSLSPYLPFFFDKEGKEYSIVGLNLDEFIGKQKQNDEQIKSFWYFDGHNRKFEASNSTREYLNNNYIIQEDFSGFQAWTRHYVVRDESNMKLEFSLEELERLKSTTEIQSSIEYFEKEDNHLIVKGWAIIKNVDSKNTKLTALLVNQQTGYVIEALSKRRLDVTKFFNQEFNADFAGFEIDVNLEKIPQGEYKLAFLLKNDTENKEGIFITKKEISIQ